MAEAPPTKPSLPEGYVVPKVWEEKAAEGAMAAMNRPTAGARNEKALPVGEHPLQLYSLGTPNGIKVTILLEELNEAKGVEYDAWKISIFQLEQFGSGFVDVNPNSKIPALMDHEFKPPLRVFESGNIMKHIAEKHDMFIPSDFRAKTECFNWLFWQMASAPFMGGGFGHFYNYAPYKIEYAIDRYTMETKRQLDVLDKHLVDKQWMCGDEYTIADMAIWPWIMCLEKFYKASEFLQLDSYVNVKAWCGRMLARPAVQRGMRVNGFGDDAVTERHSKADFDAKPAEAKE
jgi:GSH-dependent disulfide-bond oxidoreductase